MLYIFRLGAECIARPLAWSPGASVRQLSFYGPVSLYLGILFIFGFRLFAHSGESAFLHIYYKHFCTVCQKKYSVFVKYFLIFRIFKKITLPNLAG